MLEHNPIRVLIVDDHAVVRSGLSAFLLIFDDLELIGDASSGAEAIRMCEKFHPDVILMDLVMPGMDGAATTEAIRNRWSDIQVIALTSFKEEEIIKLLVEGLSNPDIAERLYVSRSTVKFHVSNILSKLGAESRTEAVAIAIQNHIIKFDGLSAFYIAIATIAYRVLVQCCHPLSCPESFISSTLLRLLRYRHFLCFIMNV